MNRTLLLFDAGLQRTLLAGRVTLSLILGTLAGWITGRLTGQAGTLMMLSAVTAMQTAMASFGPIGTPRLRVPLYALLTAAAATTLAVAVTPSPFARYAVFVIIMVVAVWVRRFPPHGFGLGMMAFNAFFFPVFMRAKPSQLGWLLLYVTLGVAAATAVRLLVLPYRPRATLRHLLDALRVRCDSLATDATPTDAELAGAMRGIDEIVLQIHELLETDASLVADEQQFQTDMFAVVSLSQLLAMQRDSTSQAAHATLAPAEADPIDRLHMHLAAMERGLSLEADRERASDAIAVTDEVDSAATDDGANDEGGDDGLRELRDSDRASIQVAIAATLSILVGSMLSEQRWYWAAMTAFYMYINVTNRGVGLRKAAERTIGTVGGIGAGLVLSYALGNHPMTELLLLFPVLFAGFWMLKSSYAVMTVMITIMLALLYEMMGMLTFDLLMLRLGETFIGAGIAVGVMYFVLPSRTADAVGRAYQQFLDAVDAMLGDLEQAERKSGAVAGYSVDVVRRMARAIGTLETTIRPVISAVPGRRARGLRKELVLSLTIRYALHRLLARVVFHSTPLDAGAFRAHVAAVRANLSRMRAQAAGLPGPDSSDARTAFDGRTASDGRTVPMRTAPPKAASPPTSATAEAAALGRVETLLGMLIECRSHSHPVRSES